MKNLKLLLIGVMAVFLLAGCSAKYQDGTYTGEYEDPEKHGVTKVEITIEEGEIVDCEMEALDEKGNLKDENYGKDAGEKNYELAQIAVQEMQKYPDLLVEAQDIEAVDSVSGATITGTHFKEAVKDALSKAE